MLTARHAWASPAQLAGAPRRPTPLNSRLGSTKLIKLHRPNNDGEKAAPCQVAILRERNARCDSKRLKSACGKTPFSALRMELIWAVEWDCGYSQFFLCQGVFVTPTIPLWNRELTGGGACRCAIFPSYASRFNSHSMAENVRINDALHPRLVVGILHLRLTDEA